MQTILFYVEEQGPPLKSPKSVMCGAGTPLAKANFYSVRKPSETMFLELAIQKEQLED